MIVFKIANGFLVVSVNFKFKGIMESKGVLLRVGIVHNSKYLKILKSLNNG